MLLTERFKIGMKESLSKKITESDIIIFSKISGDKNPIHLSDEFAKKLDLKKGLLMGIYLHRYFQVSLEKNYLVQVACIYLNHCNLNILST